MQPAQSPEGKVSQTTPRPPYEGGSACLKNAALGPDYGKTSEIIEGQLKKFKLSQQLFAISFFLEFSPSSPSTWE